MSPLISVVLPVYNADGTLPAALSCLSAQDFHDFEIMAVDDGSTDETRKILLRFAQTEPRLKPVFQEHKGIVAALEKGIAKAKGTFIARMDADDTCHVSRLGLQSAFLRTHPNVGVVSCLVEFGGCRRRQAGYARYVDWINSLVDFENISTHRFVESPLAHPSVMFRKELIHRYGGYRHGPFPEDYELWLRWLEAGVRMEKLTRKLLTWNDPPNRLSRQDPRYHTSAFYALKAKYLSRWLARHNPHHPNVIIAGAGRTTRKRAQMLTRFGVNITAYLDIDPRKIGHSIAGRPVMHRDHAPPPDSCFVLSYVASHGAREDIQSFLESRGFQPGKHFLSAA